VIDLLLDWDHSFFYLINHLWTNDFFDGIFPFIRNKYFWIPLYLFILSFIALNFRRKESLWMILGLILTIILADQFSSSLMKPYFNRLRPCNDPLLTETVRLLVNCGGGKSFTSSHATNHFAVATFLGLLARPHFKIISLLLLFWAGLISYGQVYVGVHFPLDVLCGGFCGLIIGLMVYYIFVKKRIRTLSL